MSRIRFLAAVLLGKALIWLCSLLSWGRASWGGTSLPGRLALLVWPRLISDLGEAYEQIVVVTGTNGKTTTTRALAELIRRERASWRVTTNGAGANMLSGLATALCKDRPLLPSSPLAAKSQSIAILEVDEGTLEKFCRQAKVDLMVGTNLFRDQLDRYWEIGRLAQSMQRAVDNQPQARLVLNADDPAIAFLGFSRENAVYYGLDSSSEPIPAGDFNPLFPCTGEARDNILCPSCQALLVYRHYSYSHLGEYRCPSCSHQRPFPAYVGRIDSSKEGGANGAGQQLVLYHPLGRTEIRPAAMTGTYNFYNMLAAAAAAMELGVGPEVVASTLAGFAPGRGRTEEFVFPAVRCTLLLVKNPTGMSESLRAVSETVRREQAQQAEPGRTQSAVLLAINDLSADGRDVSWLWDCDWEPLLGLDLRDTVCSGLRARDMAVCLKYFGLDPARISVIPSLEKGIRSLVLPGTGEPCRVYLLSTYTNLARCRHILKKMGAQASGDSQTKDLLSLPRTA